MISITSILEDKIGAKWELRGINMKSELKCVKWPDGITGTYHIQMVKREGDWNEPKVHTFQASNLKEAVQSFRATDTFSLYTDREFTLVRITRPE
jgi:hypothetical protein